MKIQVKTPIVEMDGDEMTRVLWAMIKEHLLLPYLDLPLEYYDLGLPSRNSCDDSITVAAAQAIKRWRVGVKCATITPDADRMSEYQLKKAWPSPNATIRAILDGTVFRKPIIVRNVIPAVQSWLAPIVIARHAYGDIYKSAEFIVPGPGKLELVFTPQDAQGESTRVAVHQFTDSGIAMAMHNTTSSIRSFARSSIQYALAEGLDIWFGAKDTISKLYHGRFRDIFQEEIDISARELLAAGLQYRYMLIDDAVAQVMKHPGGIIWACMNYDGDVMSDMVAAGFGSLGMMTSVLVSPEGHFEYEAAHGTVRRHYYEHLKGNVTSTNPVASIFAWTGALAKRGNLDENPELVCFARQLEAAVLETIEKGIVTKDLYSLVSPQPQKYYGTLEFLQQVRLLFDEMLERASADRLCPSSM